MFLAVVTATLFYKENVINEGKGVRELDECLHYQR